MTQSAVTNRRRERRRLLPPELDRRFEAIIFDWDGTAVPDRDADATRLRELIEELCVRGLHLAVVAGTPAGNVDGQLAARPSGPGRLYLSVNCGSEIYRADESRMEPVYSRAATRAENAALDRAAKTTVRELAARGVRAAIVSQRPNRRTIDLIPTREWQDPPKARSTELLTAVEKLLHGAGIAGLPEAVELAEGAARAAGLDDPRVTSDAKHLEIGLTDKSDAARWLVGELSRLGVGAGLVLIVGDEFGRGLGGLPGPDSPLLVPEAARATAVTVGAEPTGVPADVVAVGGGPERFAALLADQLARRRRGDVPISTTIRTGRSRSRAWTRDSSVRTNRS